MFTRINGIEIFYDVAGPGQTSKRDLAPTEPTIILLHGGPGMDHMVFKPAFDRLADYVQVIYFDQRACGRSDAGPENLWRFDQWADDVAAFIIQKGLNRPIVLGTSFGGFVAQRFAARHLGLSGGLVLMSTAAKPNLSMTLESLEKKGGTSAREAAAAFFSNATAPGVADHYTETCLGYYTEGDLNTEILANVIARPDVMLHFFQRGGEFASADFRDDLSKIIVPTLIVHGEEDPVFPIALAHEILDCLKAPRKQAEADPPIAPPKVRLVQIPDCGHLSEQDAPETIMTAIIEFFNIR